MLDKSDLQQIKKLLQDELQQELAPIEKDIHEIKGNIKVLSNDVSKIRKDIGIIVSYFDNKYVGLRKRVERIEEILELTSVQS